MKNQNVTPEQMQAIINIQMMKERIFAAYDKQGDFKTLCNYTYDSLFDMQCKLIPEYNNAIKLSC